jgi:hypothetical protein
MASLAPPRRHPTLKIALCVCNAVTASELAFAAVFLALFALFGEGGDVNVGFIPFMVVAALLAVVGVHLARLPWRERIGSTVANLVYFLFTAVPAVIIAFSNRFRLLFCVMPIAPLVGCGLCVCYLSVLRREQRAKAVRAGTTAFFEATRDDEITTSYSYAVEQSPSSSEPQWESLSSPSRADRESDPMV